MTRLLIVPPTNLASFFFKVYLVGGTKNGVGNFPLKKTLKTPHILFAKFTVDFVRRLIGEKYEFFFKNLPPVSQKKRQNSAKKIIKKSLTDSDRFY